MDIKILPSESVMILGMKGSGKTTVLNYLIGNAKITGTRRIVILDTKQVGDFAGYPTVDELKNLPEIVSSNPISVYAPNKEEKNDIRYMDALFAWAFDRWNTVVVIDELTSIVEGNKTPASYRDLTDRGRARNVVVYQGNQKPVFVPHSALSESDHYFVFDLMVETDREKVAGILGRKVLKRPDDPHGFWYYHKSMREPVYCPGLQI